MPDDAASHAALTRGWQQRPSPSAKWVPEEVRTAIQRATNDDAAFSTACRLFLEDTRAGRFDDTVRSARLEHAIARAMLDAWAHGQGTADDVGEAYALVGERIAAGDPKRS
jgi:hypothetical protein